MAASSKFAGIDFSGYITLLADKLKVDEQILIEEGVQYRTFPAIKIGLLAADQRTELTRKKSLNIMLMQKKMVLLVTLGE